MKLVNLCNLIIYSSTQQHEKLNRHQVIKLLFSLTVVICLLFGQVVTAQTPNTNALVERGIKEYNAGNFANAIANWQEALNQYKNNPSARAVLNENLARAYQQIGENKDAIASLEKAMRDYGAVENIQQVGRMKSELAQVYSNLSKTQVLSAVEISALLIIRTPFVDMQRSLISRNG